MSTPYDGGSAGGHGDEAAPTGPDPASTQDSEVFEAEVLSERESAQVARRFAHAGEVQRRRAGQVARHGALAVRRAAGRAWHCDQGVRVRSVTRYRVR
jgi:hypothetical protein